MAPSPTSSNVISMLEYLSSIYETHLIPLLPQPASTLLGTFNPFPPFLKLISSYQNATTGSGDIWSIVLLLITLYMTLRVANYVRQSIFGWIWFGGKMLVLLGIVQVVLYVKAYGWEKTVNDAGWWSSMAWNWVESAMQGDTKNKSWSKGGGSGSWNTAAGGRRGWN